MEYKDKYEERLTLYVDLLGFKQILSETEIKKGVQYIDNKEKIIDLQKAYMLIYESLETQNIKDKATDKMVTIFSDSIVVSMIPKRANHFSYLLNSIRKMIIDLANIGILCRGAITYGKLIHTNKYVFGPALVEAYILESKSANYPRVIIDYAIIQKLINLNDRIKIRKDFLKKDLDGMYYLDYFDLFTDTEDFAKVFNDDLLAIYYLSNLKEHISNSLKRYNRYNNADIRVKYVWMREKINSAIRVVHELFKDSKELLDRVNLDKTISSVSDKL